MTACTTTGDAPELAQAGDPAQQFIDLPLTKDHATSVNSTLIKNGNEDQQRSAGAAA
jgi:hypothetical protein